ARDRAITQHCPQEVAVLGSRQVDVIVLANAYSHSGSSLSSAALKRSSIRAALPLHPATARLILSSNLSRMCTTRCNWHDFPCAKNRYPYSTVSAESSSTSCSTILSA